MEILQNHGIHYVFLPPYNPFFNPIEECFGYVKSSCRRFYEEFQDRPMHEAIQEAFGKVTVDMISGYYRRAGYE